jgi:hypothetical protein
MSPRAPSAIRVADRVGRFSYEIRNHAPSAGILDARDAVAADCGIH